MTCSICLDTINNDLKLDCGHDFHKSCIDKWFETQTNEDHILTCPLCRFEVKKPNNEDESK